MVRPHQVADLMSKTSAVASTFGLKPSEFNVPVVPTPR